LPLYLDLTSRSVVIFGGGAVGERKARLFSDYSRVLVVSRSFTPELLQMEKEGLIEIIQTDLSKEVDNYLKDAFIVIPATDDIGLNRFIGARAAEMGVLVNQVDGIGDVVVPSIVKKDPITIAISTLGESPALSRYLRQRMESELKGNYADMGRLLGEMRIHLKTTVPDQKTRKEILWEILLDQEVWELLDQSYEKAFKKAGEHVIRDEPDSLDASNPQDSIHRRD
jgi:precorrin-2 dehydrogenase/sirohydrochlorin ferrochelatase